MGQGKGFHPVAFDEQRFCTPRSRDDHDGNLAYILDASQHVAVCKGLVERCISQANANIASRLAYFADYAPATFIPVEQNLVGCERPAQTPAKRQLKGGVVEVALDMCTEHAPLLVLIVGRVEPGAVPGFTRRQSGY